MTEPPRKVAKLTQLPAPEDVITEKDLPLLANVGQVKVLHYLIKMRVCFERKKIIGTAVLFLEWAENKKQGEKSEVVLDQCFLDVKRVVSVITEAGSTQVVKRLKEFGGGTGARKNFYLERDWFGEDGTELQWTQSKWALTVKGWEDGPPPNVLRIEYETLETSPSIHWRPCDGFKWDEASNKCCYSPAPMMNNRGLFPCQEPPSAMATWEVLLECEPEYTPLLSSDQSGEIVEKEEGGTAKTHYFYCNVPLPMSTFAMVVGKFHLAQKLQVPSEVLAQSLQATEENTEDLEDLPDSCSGHPQYPCRFGNAVQRQENLIPVRLFSLDPDIIPVDLTKFSRLVYSSLLQSYIKLGPHPFSRLDIVIVPKCYPHMGLTNPSMIFLSRSNFYGDEPLYVSRLPHEICHNWFGLLIGSLDWTEEWLSEGFATFCEDLLTINAYQTYFSDRSTQEIERDQSLKILMRYTSLQTELRNTSGELHVMAQQSSRDNLATNGLVPIKQFMQVHYYKGYLLLWHMCSRVGQPEFLKFLKTYVWRYHGQLVTSGMFLEAYYSHFKDDASFKDLNEGIVSSLKTNWLQSSSIPEPYNSLDFLFDDNLTENSVPALFAKSVKPLKSVKRMYSSLLKGSKQVHVNFEALSASEILLLMELILAEEEQQSVSENRKKEKRQQLENLYFQQLVTSPVFQQVQVEHRFNADVMHRWCELIVCFRDKARLPVVEQFLRNNIATGVYLYGELMITERYVFQKRAKQLYHELKNVYDLATKQILKEMLF